ncbi:MAG: TetR/AcrR family transcriptional regulator [Acidimicrobiia bacterium]|nr:TetR/AcrR family transcriptional regulator [Acidimicrobiia bacterium]
MGRYRAGVETRRRIIEATRHLLAEVGIEGTTIKAICERASILPGSFYNLFTSKEEALLTVVREAIEAVDPDVAGEGTDTLADLIGAYVRFVEEQPALARIYLQIAVTGGVTDRHLTGRLLRHSRYRNERFADAIFRADRSMDPATAQRRAHMMIAALNGLTIAKLLEPDLDLADHTRELLEFPVIAPSA